MHRVTSGRLNHIRKVYACLAVTCNLHFWQNDRDLLRATAVTRGWNGYGIKSQHRKLTLESVSADVSCGRYGHNSSLRSPIIAATAASEGQSLLVDDKV